MPDNPRARGALLLAGAVAVSAAIVLLLAPLFAKLPATDSPVKLALLVTGATAVVYGMLGLAGGVGLWRTGDRQNLFGAEPGRWGASGLGIGLTGLLIAALYAWLAGTTLAGTAPRVGGAGLLLLGTLALPFQAAMEELFFRGWLQRGLRRLWGMWPALAASALAFGLLHLAGGARAPLSLLNITLAGLLFGLLAERTGGLAAPTAAHAAWNWSEQILLGLDPNPAVGPFGAILDLDLTGAALWGGSAEGLNGSVAVTIVLVALILPLVVVRLPVRRSPALG